MSFQQIFGVFVSVGSVLFLIAAFSPISKVYAESESARRLAIIQENPGGWRISQVLFGLGAVITAVAIGFWAVQIGEWLAYLSFLAMLVGALLWSWLVYHRALAPEAFAAGTLPYWPFVIYTILTQLGLAIFGSVLIMLLGSDLPGWVGWLNVVGSVLFFILYLVFKDMPPFVYYLLTLITGVMFYLA